MTCAPGRAGVSDASRMAWRLEPASVSRVQDRADRAPKVVQCGVEGERARGGQADRIGGWGPGGEDRRQDLPDPEMSTVMRLMRSPDGAADVVDSVAGMLMSSLVVVM